MPGWSTSCPNCSAPVVFGLGASLMRVCDSCGSAVIRRGGNVENHGKVAELVPTSTVLRLGLTGGVEGVGPFTIVGRIQLSHGRGVWNEWHLELPGEASGWISEAQGTIGFMKEMAPAPPLASLAAYSAGTTVDLGPEGTWVVQERGSASFVSAEGELPSAIEPGTELNYVDLSGPRGRIGTLDFGAGSEVEAVYLGRRLGLAELGIATADLPTDAQLRVEAASRALNCPHCSAPLDLVAPDRTRRVGCPSCGTLLDATESGLKVLSVIDAEDIEPPDLKLGSKGRLRGVEWTLIGHLVRSVTVDHVRYPWQEYLLYEPRHGFRWLVCSDGHWSFVEPVAAADVRRGGYSLRGQSEVGYEGRTFKHFQGGNARVDQVLGECYWEVSVGESVETSDYVKPPLMLSGEFSEDEIHWSLGTYLPVDELMQAFGLDRRPTREVGVGANEPNPHKAAAGHGWKVALPTVIALFALLMVFASRSEKLLDLGHDIDSRQRQAGRTEAYFSEPFEVARRTNLRLTLRSNVDNSWLYASGALIDESDFAARPIGVEVSYWHGKSGGDRWTEGSRKRSQQFASVKPGRYVLNLQAEFDRQRPPSRWRVEVEAGNPRLAHFIAALGLILAWPVFTSLRALNFESNRWKNSDHPWSDSE